MKAEIEFSDKYNLLIIRWTKKVGNETYEYGNSYEVITKENFFYSRSEAEKSFEKRMLKARIKTIDSAKKNEDVEEV
jgi:hypothetical protein